MIQSNLYTFKRKQNNSEQDNSGHFIDLYVSFGDIGPSGA